MKSLLRGVRLSMLLALFAGVGLGLAYSWVLAPVEYVDADPSLLRADFRDQYRAAIAAAYAASGDLPRARARLALLKDPDPAQALSSQAQQMLAAGEPLERIRQVAQLASDAVLTGSQPSGPSPTATVALTLAEPATSPAATEPTSPSDSTALAGKPAVVPTPTVRPTRTPTSTPGAAFALVGQEQVCNAESPGTVLQIIVKDARGRQVPGAQIIVNWDGGEDHFFTGFKPELGDGYADFDMEPDVSYTVRLAAGSAPVSNVTSPPCSGPNGETFDGGLLLTFQQP